MGERSSSEERYRSWKVDCSCGAVELVVLRTTLEFMRRVSGSWWDRSGDEVVLSARSGRVDAGFSKAHCWSCEDTTTSGIVCVCVGGWCCGEGSEHGWQRGIGTDAVIWGATGGHWGKESGQMGVTETGGVRDYAPQV